MKFHKIPFYSSLSPTSSVKSAIALLEKDSSSTIFVLDVKNKLLGTVVDGDIRRAFLAGHTIDTEVRLVMNKSFLSLNFQHAPESVQAILNHLGNLQVPVLRDDGSIDSVYTLPGTIPVNLPVVIMAGGRGVRLSPLTDSCPKPMLQINGQPMLELIIINLISLGVREFFISVNYLKHMIIDYFGDGSSLGVSITYLEEEQPLGTAGSLSLLPKNFDSNFLVVNADILSRVDYKALFSYFIEHSPDALMCIRANKLQIPFGVVQHNGHSFIGVQEKPNLEFMINTGVYILSPKVLSLIKSHFLDMPLLFELMTESKYDIHVFPIHEDWYDVGVPSSLNQVSLLNWN